MSKSKIITLDCGIQAEQRISNSTEWLEISLMSLYQGYGEKNNFELLSKLFLELHSKGFVGQGLSRQVGYYDSTEDITLRASRKL